MGEVEAAVFLRAFVTGVVVFASGCGPATSAAASLGFLEEVFFDCMHIFYWETNNFVSLCCNRPAFPASIPTFDVFTRGTCL